MHLSTLLLALALIVAFGVGVMAVVRGTAAERLAGAAFLIWIPASLLVSRLPGSWVTVAQLGNDAIFAFIFLGLAVRFASWWLGGIMILYAAQFALHGFYFVTGRDADRFHALANNLIFVGVILTLLAGTLTAKRRTDA